jgi:hypothetical protein
MTVSMYGVSAPIFVQFLTALSANLDKAAAFAEAKKIEQSVLLNIRLSVDQFPLARQVREATNHARTAMARLADAENPTFANDEATIAELQQRIAKSIDFIKSVPRDKVDGTEDKTIVFKFPSGAERTFTGQTLLLNFSLPNFYFHNTTAYAIMRHCGIEVGKSDFMGKPVTL